MKYIADELVRVKRFPGSPTDTTVWLVEYGVDPADYLVYDRRETAEEAAQRLKALVGQALAMYKRSEDDTSGIKVSHERASHGDKVTASEPSTLKGHTVEAFGVVGPDLFAGSIQSISAILGKVAGLLGLHAAKVIDLMKAAKDLHLELERAHLPRTSQIQGVMIKSTILKDAIEALSKEW